MLEYNSSRHRTILLRSTEVMSQLYSITHHKSTITATTCWTVPTLVGCTVQRYVDSMFLATPTDVTIPIVEGNLACLTFARILCFLVHHCEMESFWMKTTVQVATTSMLMIGLGIGKCCINIIVVFGR